MSKRKRVLPEPGTRPEPVRKAYEEAMPEGHGVPDASAGQGTRQTPGRQSDGGHAGQTLDDPGPAPTPNEEMDPGLERRVRQPHQTHPTSPKRH
jgi:hypothetical protein